MGFKTRIISPKNSRALIVGLAAFLQLFFVASHLSAAETFEARVIGVSDGDTITVLRGTTQAKIRLHGIDTPEMGQAFGRVAKKTTSDLCFGKTVNVRPIDTDRYGRTVAIVYLDDGRELNLELIKAGVAWHYRKYSADRRYASAEKEARNARVGLWRDKNPVPPWEYRRNRRSSTMNSPAVSTGYHGNVKSGVFHKSTCRHFNCKNCTAGFGSRKEAIQEGYRPCGNCKP